MKNEILTYKLNPEATLPTRNHSWDAGLDLYALESIFIPVGKTIKVSTGIALLIEEGHVGKIEGRSSMNVKGLLTSGGVIDAGYNGEVGVVLTNLNNTTDTYIGTLGYWVKKGDKVAQLLVYDVVTPKVTETKELWNSERGSKGFGSSNR